MVYNANACQCRECATCVKRRQAKRNAANKANGNPATIYGEKFQWARRQVLMYHDEVGMSWAEIAEVASRVSGRSISIGTIHCIGSGYRHEGKKRTVTQGILRGTYLAIKAMGEAEIVPNGRAFLDITPTRRMLQALVYRGFTLQFLGEELGCNRGNVSTRARPNGQPFVTKGLHDRVTTLYDKLAYADPGDYGISLQVQSRMHNLARDKWHAAPAHCWDEDTIRDPQAAPEWTGHCGKLAGVLIHLRQDQPLCDRCVYIASNPHGHNKIDPFKLYELHSAGTHTYREIAKLMGVSRDLVCQYGQYLATEERRVHRLSDVDKIAKIGYCDLCRDQVKLYVSTGSKLVCSNGVKKRWEASGHVH